MGKDFSKKYMHPTRRKLVDMVHTGKYEKNATVGYEAKKEDRKVGDNWSDEHYNYEKKDGYILKTGKNHQAFQEIRNYLEEKSKCKNSECKTVKLSKKDKTFIEKGGFCMDCTIEREHQLRVAGIFEDYQNYKVWTRMVLYGRGKIDQYKQSIDDLKEEYEMVGSEGKVTETWKLPKPIDEVKAEIQELIDYGENELKELEEKRQEAFNRIKEKNYEHFI